MDFARWTFHCVSGLCEKYSMLSFPSYCTFDWSFHSYGRLLNLTNVTSKDTGSYTCEITTELNGLVTADVLVKVVHVGELQY